MFRLIKVRAVAAGLGLVAVAAMTGPAASSASGSDITIRALGSSPSPGYVAKLHRSATAHKSFGFWERAVGHHIIVDFVGVAPADVRDIAAQAPAGWTVDIGRSMYTHDTLQRALNHAMASRDFDIQQGEILKHGRGLSVFTLDNRLLHSVRPNELLGINVGVIVHRGAVTPAAQPA